MKSQTLNLIMEKPSTKQSMLLVGFSIALTNTAMTLAVNAQSYSQDSYLPPEVVPINQSINYGTNSTPAKSISSLLPESNLSESNTPGVVSQISQRQNLQNFQTPQQARQALYDSWANNQIFSQANNQTSYNETANPMNNFSNPNFSNQNMPAGQGQNLAQMMPQNPNSQTYNTANNPAPPQTQVLSGSVNTQPTSQQRTSGGISHLTGVLSGLAMGAFSLSSMGNSGGGIYSAGLLGGGVANYGLNSGLRF